jgi:hypothetical protein
LSSSSLLQRGDFASASTPIAAMLCDESAARAVAGKTADDSRACAERALLFIYKWDDFRGFGHDLSLFFTV